MLDLTLQPDALRHSGAQPGDVVAIQGIGCVTA
jgi:hypothetical protein